MRLASPRSLFVIAFLGSALLIAIGMVAARRLRPAPPASPAFFRSYR
jgi:hypothetical protein